MKRIHRNKTRRSDRRGAAVAELAVCLPLIVLLVIGTVEACTMIFLKQSLTIAAYEGGRTALVPGATNGDVTAECQQVVNDRGVQGGTIAVTPADITAAAPGTYLQIDVSAQCDTNSMLGNWFYAGKTLNGHVEVMKEY